MNEGRTARWQLPLLAAGQAQKEIAHNEALALIDAAVQPCVLGMDVTVPPADPQPGECWAVGTAPTGAFSGRAQALATWTDGGWRFVAPQHGTTAWDKGRATTIRFDGERWVAIATPGAAHPAISAAVGGATVDVEARAALAGVLAALSHHGLIEAAE
jgi:hypothetical protein